MTADPAAATITLRGDYVTLAQAVKAVGLADTGGQAKVLVREGTYQVNGAVEKRPGAKLRAGDRFGPVAGGGQWTVVP
jgi:ribosome-associated protein